MLTLGVCFDLFPWYSDLNSFDKVIKLAKDRLCSLIVVVLSCGSDATVIGENGVHLLAIGNYETRLP